MHSRRKRIHTVVAALLAAVLTAGWAESVRAEECLNDWGAAGEIVRREKLLTVQQLTQTEEKALGGQIVKTTLCKDGDDYIYKVVVRNAAGSLKTMVIDARPSPGAATVPAKSR